ncbi:MAG: hypothetical protein HYZ28_18920 [Myxococcales bacterium]|nr:hypothetical protein [Myxococcales bacterium]
MGLFKKIGKAFKKIGKGIGKVAKGVVKFAKSPLGKVLIGVGLTALTGGAGAGLLAKVGLGGLKFGNLASTFSGFASKFLGPATNLLSKSGLGSVVNFAKTAVNSGDLFKMAQSLMQARKESRVQADPATNQAANFNIAQILAWVQAQQAARQQAA